MSWITKLNEAYACGICGKSDLIPIGFTTKEVKYLVTLHADGTFDTAHEYPPKTFLIVPTSPKAETRTGDCGTPFPLVDQLKYLVSEDGHDNPRFDAYLQALDEWCSEEDAPNCLHILKSYLEQKTLLEDMMQKAHLNVQYSDDKNGYGKGKDAKAMLAFAVHSPDFQDNLWERQDVRESWSCRFAKVADGKLDLCYATGDYLPIMENHPKVQGNAKLVSGKDAEFPFVYKGRFIEDSGATAVGSAAASKAYNALDWLIRNQGFCRYGLTLVAWNTDGSKTLNPLEAGEELFDEETENEICPDTFEAYGRAISTAMNGYRVDLRSYDAARIAQTVILGLEKATDGRMSINYYQEMTNQSGGGSDYVTRLEQWFLSCCWAKYSPAKKKMVLFTPSPHQIAEAVMGKRAVQTADKDKRIEKAITKQVRQLLLRLLSCITLSEPVPSDIVHSAFHRSVQPQQFRSERDNSWEEQSWRNTIATTCALIYKYQTQSYPGAPYVITPDAALQKTLCDRSYLYGRLLAAADFLEYEAMERMPGRMTNAVSIMPAFAQRPADSWLRLHNKLIPYLRKLEPQVAEKYQILFGSIEALFSAEDCISNAPLTELFLPGYYSQRQFLYQSFGKPDSVTFIWPKERNMLYGCMTAIADIVECTASDGQRSGRTNALQNMSTSLQRPISGWAHTHMAIIPYLEKMEKKSKQYSKLLRICEAQFGERDRIDASALDRRFLRGYYLMRIYLMKNPEEKWEKYTQEIEPDTRDAVFGMLLGYENRTERLAMDYIQRMDDKNFRLSNAYRYMRAFSYRPWTTWNVLKDKLVPYQKRFPDGGAATAKKIADLEQIIMENGWDNDEPLNGSYLNCFYCV